MKRVLLAMVMLLPLTLTAQESAGKGSKSVRVTPQWNPQCQFAGIYMAYEKGFYAEEGLDVEIKHPSVARSSVTMLETGETDIITSQLIESITSKDGNPDLIHFLQTSNHSSLVLLSREPLSDMMELNNKKIGRWNAGFSQLAIAAFAERGLNVEWIRFLNNISLYISGAIDATLCMEYNELFQLRMSGTPVTEEQLVRFKDTGYDIPDDGLYTTRAFYDANTETVERFAAATKRGWDWIRESEENRRETIDYVLKLAKSNNIATNRLHQEWMLASILSLQEDAEGEVPYRLTKEAFDYAVTLLYNNGFIKTKHSYDMFTRQ